MESILSGVGLPQDVWRGEKWRVENSWTAKRSYVFENGAVRMAKTVNVQDNALFPEHFKAQSVTFRAGLELKLLNCSVDAVALLNRFRQKPPPDWLLLLCHSLSIPTKSFGSDQGGMLVKVIGEKGERLSEKVW